STVSSPLLLRPSSMAAIMVKALASPIPLKEVSCFRFIFPNWFKLFWEEERILLHRSTALSLVLPDPIRIARSSASVKDNLPFAISFSLGRSPVAQFFIVKGDLSFAIIFSHLLKDKKLMTKMRAIYTKSILKLGRQQPA